MSLNKFDAILYINLDHRKDRKKLLLAQLEKYGVDKKKIHRISAEKVPLNGYIGTVLSHIKALDFAIANNLNTTLILEDDCLFHRKLFTFNKILLYFLENFPHWDVFLLGGQFFKTQDTQYPHILKILKSYDSHAYALQKHYLPILKKCFLESYEKIKYDTFAAQSEKVKKTILDVYWNKLQAKDKWYGLNVQLAVQNDSYSDNQKRHRDYSKLLESFPNS